MASLTGTKRSHDEDPPEDAPQGPSAKREKLQGATADAEYPKNPPWKDGEFWFEDGNIILVVGNWQFRVYKGMLMSQSQVFKDMFTLGQPSSQPHDNPACPVMHLDDDAEDFRHVLRACMPINDDSFISVANPSFYAIWARIHLGDKYHMYQLWEQGIAFLKAHYNADLDNRDKLAASGWVPRGWKREEVIGVVNLARFVDEASILPTALLGCMALGTKFVSGFTREDTGLLEQLSTEDLGICVAACATGRILAASASARIRLAGRLGSCNVVTPAPRHLAQYGPGSEANRVVKMVEKLVRVVDPLAKISDCLGPNEIHHCPACYKAAEEWDRLERRRLWNCLPDLLGIQVSNWADATEVTSEKGSGD